MSDIKPTKRTPSWFVVKASARIGNDRHDVYLDVDGYPIPYLSGAARFATFATAARRLHTFQNVNSTVDESTRWSARVVGLLTKSGQP